MRERPARPEMRIFASGAARQETRLRRHIEAEGIFGVTAFMGAVAVLLSALVTTHHTRLDRAAASRPAITDQAAKLTWSHRT